MKVVVILVTIITISRAYLSDVFVASPLIIIMTEIVVKIFPDLFPLFDNHQHSE